MIAEHLLERFPEDARPTPLRMTPRLARLAVRGQRISDSLAEYAAGAQQRIDQIDAELPDG